MPLTISQALEKIEQLDAEVGKIKKQAEEAKKAEEGEDADDAGDIEDTTKRQERVRDNTKFQEKNAKHKIMTNYTKLFKALKAADELDPDQRKEYMTATIHKFMTAMTGQGVPHFKGPQMGKPKLAGLTIGDGYDFDFEPLGITKSTVASQGEEGDEARLRRGEDAKTKRQSQEEGEEGEEEGEEGEEAKRSMKAELKILRKEAASPRIDYLASAYKGRVDDRKLRTYMANWRGMTLSELDEEIARVKPFVGSIAQKTSNVKPYIYSASAMESSDNKDEFTGSIEGMSLTELIN